MKSSAKRIFHLLCAFLRTSRAKPQPSICVAQERNVTLRRGVCFLGNDGLLGDFVCAQLVILVTISWRNCKTARTFFMPCQRESLHIFQHFVVSNVKLYTMSDFILLKLTQNLKRFLWQKFLNLNEGKTGYRGTNNSFTNKSIIARYL